MFILLLFHSFSSINDLCNTIFGILCPRVFSNLKDLFVCPTYIMRGPYQHALYNVRLEYIYAVFKNKYVWYIYYILTFQKTQKK